MKNLTLFVALMLQLNASDFVVQAHDWYPMECCHDKDCHPVPCDEITMTGDFYRWHGFNFPASIVQPSPDGACHVCIGESGFTKPRPRCLFFGASS
jgi:hypothetical protein